MKKLFLTIAIIGALYVGWDRFNGPADSIARTAVADDEFARAFQEQRSGVQVMGEGVVHWTHHDPKNEHQTGWLKHHGESYQ